MTEPTLVILGIENPSKLACIARSRTYKQYCNMVEKTLKGECPFCEIGPENVIIAENFYWKAWQNPFPEKHTKHHFIIVPVHKRRNGQHAISILEMDIREKLGLFTLMDDLCQEHHYASSGILIRDGDATLSAGTIEHLHIHVMVPDGTGRVESPFYKGAEEERTGILRAIVFEKMRRGTSLVHLSDKEKELVKGRVV